MTAEHAQYMTLDAFRRGFFAKGSRPSRAQARRWIEQGRLDGVEIDGRVYVTQSSAQVFFTRAQIKKPAGERVEVDGFQLRQALARSRLREFGFEV